MPSPTASQVNRAGQRLRRHLRGEVLDLEQISGALDTLVTFRAEHSGPLNTATMGLRSAVTSERLPLQVSQRLKRVPTILGKLVREPTLALSKMQDIGGCRAVVPTVDDLRAVQMRLTERPSRTRDLVSVSDYVSDPRESGYRGVHVIVRYGGRLIEIQLRTRLMHEWAFTVERLADNYDEAIKGGWIPEVSPFLATVSHAMALEEAGKPIPAIVVREMEHQRLQLNQYLRRRR